MVKNDGLSSLSEFAWESHTLTHNIETLSAALVLRCCGASTEKLDLNLDRIGSEENIILWLAALEWKIEYGALDLF